MRERLGVSTVLDDIDPLRHVRGHRNVRGHATVLARNVSQSALQSERGTGYFGRGGEGVLGEVTNDRFTRDRGANDLNLFFENSRFDARIRVAKGHIDATVVIFLKGGAEGI